MTTIRQEFFNDVQLFLLSRGWRLKVAKTKPAEQSLFVHALNELGALMIFLSDFTHPYTKQEQKNLLVAALAHDCGKELEDWQEHVRKGEPTGGHCDRDYIQNFLSELNNFMSVQQGVTLLDQSDMHDVVSAIMFHMKSTRRDPRAVLGEMLVPHGSERWSEMAKLVKLFDGLVSIGTISEATSFLTKEGSLPLAKRLEIAYHQVANVRGVLTILLHKACESAYEKAGYKPFLYYPDGTLYVREFSLSQQAVAPAVDDIRNTLREVIEQFLSQTDDVAAIVGVPKQKLFLLPEVFRKEHVEEYFARLRRRYRSKVDKVAVKKALEKIYDHLNEAKQKLKEALGKEIKQKIEQGQMKDNEFIDQILKNLDELTYSFPELRTLTERRDISVSKSQQYMFQFFKEIVIDTFDNETAFLNAVRVEYEEYFGEGRFETLKSKSTTMPEKDFHVYIQPYWELEYESTKIRFLPTEKQEKILANKLASILNNNLDKCEQLPKDYFLQKVVDALIEDDLLYPIALQGKDVKKWAQAYITALSKGKKDLFKNRPCEGVCPFCNSIMQTSKKLRAEMLPQDEQGTVKVFNNRATGAIPFQASVSVCPLCYAEFLLRRLVLGRTPADLVILFPSFNFQRIQGFSVLTRMRQIQNQLSQFYSWHNPNFNERVQLNYMSRIVTELIEQNIDDVSSRLDPEKFVQAFHFQVSNETKDKDIEKIRVTLENWWDSVGDFNNEFGTNYSSLKEAAKAIFERGCPIPQQEFAEIIEESGVNSVRYASICETPNLILISLPFTFGDIDMEADVNIILKRALFSAYLYLATDCAVMVVPGKEVAYIPEERKAVYVQPNATLRQILQEEWISILDLGKWMTAIATATRLAYLGEYSSRSGIFEVLNQPTVGHILSRITSQKTPSGAPKRATTELINILDKLAGTEVLKNEKAFGTKV